MPAGAAWLSPGGCDRHCAVKVLVASARNAAKEPQGAATRSRVCSRVVDDRDEAPDQAVLDDQVWRQHQGQRGRGRHEKGGRRISSTNTTAPPLPPPLPSPPSTKPSPGSSLCSPPNRNRGTRDKADGAATSKEGGRRQHTHTAPPGSNSSTLPSIKPSNRPSCSSPLKGSSGSGLHLRTPGPG